MNILIADDEVEIREGLAEMLQSSEYRFQAIHKVPDGVGALEALTSTAIDIVISDIRMPRMDGLKLTGEIRSRYPDVKVIILSGFGDFHFVQQAVRLGATDFLLKPTSLEELNNCLGRVMKQLKTTKRKSLFRTLDRFGAHEAPHRLLIACDLNEIDSERAREFGGEAMVGWLFHKVVQEAVEERESGVCIIQELERLEMSNIVIGVYGDSRAAVAREADRLVEDIHSFWTRSIRLSANFGLHAGSRDETAAPAELLFRACCTLLQRIFEPQVVGRSDRPLPPVKAKYHTEHLRAALALGDLAAVFAELQAQLGQLLQLRNAPALVQGTETILMTLCESLPEAKPGSAGRAAALAQLMGKLLWARNERQYVREIMMWTGNQLASANIENQGGQILQQAKKHIYENMHSPLTLAEVGQAIYVSPGYLSRVFRERAGQTFLEYLTELRMNKAKQLLLAPGAKIYEVAEKVGYGSYKQFSRTFKEQTGYTPVEYRKEARIGDEAEFDPDA